MIRNIKKILLIPVFTLYLGCSFDGKTGIWSGEEDEKRLIELQKKQKGAIETVKIYSSDETYSKEIFPTQKITLSKPKKNLSWKMSGLNLQNYLGNIYLQGINNNFLKKRIGKDKFKISQIMSPPVIFDENIIFSDDIGTIYSINQNGEINWKKNIYKKVYKKIYKKLTFSIYKNKIYIADNIGFIYVINLENGEAVWIKNHGVPIKSNIKIFENKIYLVNQDNRILCLDVEKGSKIWDNRTITSFIKSQNFLALAISQSGDLFVLNSSGDLIKARTSNGSMYWTLNATGSMLAHSTDFFSSSDIVLVDDEIIFSTSLSTYSYNLTTGLFNWEQQVGSKNIPIVDGNNVFLMSDNGYFVNLNRKSGDIIWSLNILKVLKKRKQKTNITGFIIGSGKVYAVTLNGYLIVCSVHSGEIEYFKKIADSITASPIISNGSLYILTSESRIFGFN